MSKSSSAELPQGGGDISKSSSSKSLKQQLEEFREKKRKALMKADDIRTEAASPVTSTTGSNPRKFKTFNMGTAITEEPRDSLISMSSSSPCLQNDDTSSTSPSSTDIKRPPRRTQPTFHDDVNNRTNLPGGTASPHLSGDKGEVLTQQNQRPLEMPKERPCVKCQVMLSVSFKFCQECGARQMPQMPSPAPRRASSADTSHTDRADHTDHHANLQAAAASDIPHVRKGNIPTSQDSSPRVNASGQSGVDQLKEKEEAFRRHKEKEAAAAAAAASAASASRHDTYSSPPSVHKTSPPSSHREQEDCKSGLDYLRKKEEAYKQAQRKKGVREEDLEPLQERVDEERRLREEEKAWHRDQAHPPHPVPQLDEEQKKVDTQKKVKPDPLKFKRENLLKNNYAKQNDEEARIAALENDGQALLKAIKVRLLLGNNVSSSGIPPKETPPPKLINHVYSCGCVN